VSGVGGSGRTRLGQVGRGGFVVRLSRVYIVTTPVSGIDGRFRAMWRSGNARKSLLRGVFTWWWALIVMVAGLFVWLIYRFNSAGWVFALAGVVSVIVIGVPPMSAVLQDLAREAEAQAHQRVRQAEDQFSSVLRSGSLTPDDLQQLDNFLRKVAKNQADGTYRDRVPDPERIHEVQVPGPERIVEVTKEVPGPEPVILDKAEAVEQLAIKQRDERLTLAALWDVTHSRMGEYHIIVTQQAKRSFGAAQAAMAIGFVLLIVFAVLAAEAKTTAAAISAGGLGAVGAAFSGYIARTFIRSQETAASHLRAYFDQPLELSRYLAAERLLADAKDLSPEKRADILSAVVQSIAAAGQHDGKANGVKPARRQPRGNASR